MIDRYGIHVGELYFRFYGMIIMFGAVLAAILSNRRAKKAGQDPELIWDMLIWLLIAGVLGARIWHIFTPPPSMQEQGITTMYYLTHPLEMLTIWNGGLGIPGAVIGGALALFFYTRKHRLNFAQWTDIIAPGLLLAQAIGRWGNFVNQEVYGAPTNLPWKIYIEPMFRLPEYANVEYYHPLFLYESLWNLAGMLLLVWMGNRFSHKLKFGDVFLGYLVVYPLGRFLLEFLRLDSAQIAGINANQTFMAIIGILAVITLFWRHRPGQKSRIDSMPDPIPTELESNE